MSPAAASSLTRLPTQGSRLWVSRLVAGAAIGACVGAILGGVIFNVMGRDSTATAIVRLTPMPDLSAIATGAQRSTPDTEGFLKQYVAGEVAFLSGVGFTRAVGDSLARSEPPDLDVLQEGDTSVVVLTSSAGAQVDAIRIVQTAIDIYRAELAQRADRQLRTILAALDEWELAAHEVGDAPHVGEIRSKREAVRLQGANPDNITVLQPPTADETFTEQWLLGAMLGALAGGAGVPLRQLAIRRRSGLLTSPGEIVDDVDGVLVPAVDLRKAPPVAQSDELTTLARTLYAQSSSPARARHLVIIGASASSGTAPIAALFELAAAQAGPVKMIRLTDAAPPSSFSADGNTTVIIDAGALTDSTLIPEATRHATDLVVVARLGVDTLPQVYTVRAATASCDAPLMAVITYRPWWALPLRRASGTADGPVRRPAAHAAGARDRDASTP